MKVCTPTAIVVSGALLLGSGAVAAQTVARFQTRAPTECPTITAKPSPVEAATLIRCRQESMSEGEIYLLDQLRVQLGGPQPYNERTHTYLTGVDTSSSVYPLRGNYTGYRCVRTKDGGEGTNCVTTKQSNATGYCWLTTFGNWDCIIAAPSSDIVQNQPPPAN